MKGRPGVALGYRCQSDLPLELVGWWGGFDVLEKEFSSGHGR